jgi:GNAT superfamily N-acetyltransferase
LIVEYKNGDRTTPFTRMTISLRYIATGEGRDWSAMVEIRQITGLDSEPIWEIWQTIIVEGDAFYSDESIPKANIISMWCNADAYVAVHNECIIGTYCVFPIRHGRGSHIADGCYMVAPQFRRQGVGTLLARHSLQRAKESGYEAMQFDCVVSSNKAAVNLWRKLGFTIVGTVPKGFQHPKLGLVDIFIMHSFL